MATSQLRVVFLSHTHRESVFKVGSFHLSREFARLGFEVAHISTPVSLVHWMVPGKLSEARRHAAKRGPYRSSDGVLDYTPRTIIPIRWLFTNSQLRSILRSAGFSSYDVAIVDQPLFHCRELGRSSYVLRLTDVIEDPVSLRRVAKAIRSANGVVVTSPKILQALGELQIPSHVIENGVDLTRFGPISGVRSGMVYVGAIDRRFDFDALYEMSASAPDLPVDVYGPIGDVRVPIAGRPQNVNFRGPLSYEQLPVVLQAARIGVLPFQSSDLNAGRSPMKLYEYLAAGLTVVGPDTVIRGLTSADGVYVYHDLSTIAAAVRSARMSVTPNETGRELAARQGWRLKAEELVRVIRSFAHIDLSCD